MSLFYDAPKDFKDVTEKKKNEQAQKQQQIKQNVESTPAPYNKAKAAPTVSKQYRETASKNKKSSSKSSSSKSSSSKSSGSSYSDKKNNVRNDFSIGKETSIFSQDARDNVSSDSMRKTFAPNAVFGSDVFGKISRGSSSGRSADEIKRNPQLLYKSDNTAFYNDYQEKSSRNKQYNPFIAQMDILSQTGSHILTPDSDYSPSRIEAFEYLKTPDKFEYTRTFRDDVAPYIEQGKKSDTILNSDDIVKREYGKKALNNVLYDTVTYTTNHGKKIELLRDSAFTDKYDAQYLKRYMSDDQMNVYYYLLGKYGADEAEDYLYNDVAKTTNDKDYSELNIQRNADFAKEHPLITSAIMPFTGAHNIVQGVSNAVRDLTGDEITSRDTSASDAYYGRMKGVEESSGSVFGKLITQGIYGALYNSPEMILNAVPVVGSGLSAAAGAASSIGDKYAEQRRDGNLDNAGATADVVLAGALGAAQWGLLSKAISAPVDKLVGSGSPIKSAVSSVLKNALSAAGIGATQSAIETAVDSVTLGDNSAYSRTLENYKNSGMSDEDAFKSAVYDVYLRPAATAAIIGSGTGIAIGIPQTVKSYSDAAYIRNANLNAENNRRASLPRFEVYTDDNIHSVFDENNAFEQNKTSPTDNSNGTSNNKPLFSENDNSISQNNSLYSENNISSDSIDPLSDNNGSSVNDSFISDGTDNSINKRPAITDDESAFGKHIADIGHNTNDYGRWGDLIDELGESVPGKNKADVVTVANNLYSFARGTDEYLDIVKHSNDRDYDLSADVKSLADKILDSSAERFSGMVDADNVALVSDVVRKNVLKQLRSNILDEYSDVINGDAEVPKRLDIYNDVVEPYLRDSAASAQSKDSDIAVRKAAETTDTKSAAADADPVFEVSRTAIKKGIDDFFDDNGIDDLKLDDSARLRFETLKDRYADLVYKIETRLLKADEPVDDNAFNKHVNETETNRAELENLSKTMFDEFYTLSSHDMPSDAFYKGLYQSAIDNAFPKEKPKPYIPVKYELKPYALTSIRDVFSKSPEYGSETLEKSFVDFDTVNSASLARLKFMSDDNFDAALETVYAKLLPEVRKEFANNLLFEGGENGAERLTASIMKSYIEQENINGGRGDFVDSVYSRFTNRDVTSDAVKLLSESPYITDEFLNDLANGLDLDLIRYSDDANVRSLYDRLLKTENASQIIDKKFISDIYSSLAQKYGVDSFPIIEGQTPEQMLVAISNYVNKRDLDSPMRLGTPSHIKDSDIKLYGRDIELDFRRSNIEMTEGDCVAFANIIRTSVSDAFSALNKMIDGGGDISESLNEKSVLSYERYADTINKSLNAAVKYKNFAEEDIHAIANIINKSYLDAVTFRISSLRKRMSDVLSFYASDTELNGRKISKRQAENTNRIIDTLDRVADDNDLLNISKTYFNTLNKDPISADAKAYMDTNPLRFLYKTVTNEGDLRKAYENLPDEKSCDKALKILMEKTKNMYSSLDIATAIAIRDIYDDMGLFAKADDAAVVLTKLLSNSGQTLQAAQIMDILSPRAQFERLVKRNNKQVQAEVDKFKSAKEIRSSLDRARNKDKETFDFLAKERKEAFEEVNELTGVLTELQNTILKAAPEDLGVLKLEEASIKERISLKREYIESLRSGNYDLIKKLDAAKKMYDKRISKAHKKFETYSRRVKKELTKVEIELSKVRDDVNSAKQFSDRFSETYHVLTSKEADLRIELQKVQREFQNSVDESTKMKRWLERLYKQADKTKNVLDGGFEEDRVLNEYKINHIPVETIEWARSMFNLVDSLADTDEVIEFILQMSDMRKTARGPALEAALKSIAEKYTYAFGAKNIVDNYKVKNNKSNSMKLLSEIAKMQVHSYVKDLEPSSRGQKTNFIHTFVQLFGGGTILRNITSTAVFGEVETLSHNVGAVIDKCIISNITGQRAIGFEAPFSGLKQGMDSAQFAYLGTALNVPLTKTAYISDARIDYRTFRSRPMSVFERSLSYSLAVPDEFFKGISDYRTAESLKKLGWNKEDIKTAIRNERDYRTFNDDALLKRALSGLKKGLNHVGVGKGKDGNVKDFGLGDFIIKYPMVGSVIQKTVEYSPLGYIKAFYNLGVMVRNVKRYGNSITPQEQRSVILDFARPTTGFGVIGIGALLAQLGVIVGTAFVDKEYNEDKYEEAKGLDDLMINLSWLGRLADGETDPKPHDGDILADLSYLQPFNELLIMGAKFSELTQSGDPVSASGIFDVISGVPLDVVNGMPMMQSITNLMKTYEKTKSVAATVGGFGADSIIGFIPQPVRQAGNVMDKFVRNPYKNDSLDVALDKFLSRLPYMPAREEVPKKIDIWGNEVSSTTQNLFLDIFNEFANPGKLSVYTENEINDEIDRLLPISKDILPDMPYDNMTGYVDNIPYSFELKDKDYEEFSRLNGNIAFDGLSLMIDSYYYNQMPDNKRVELLANITKEASSLARTIWVAEKNGLKTDDEIDEMIDDFLNDCRSDAAYETKTSQVVEYLVSDSDTVENVLGSYAVVKVPVSEWSQDRINDELASYDEKLEKLYSGNYYKKDDNGEWHKSSEWSKRTVETEIEETLKWKNRILDGTATYDRQIEGKWSDLSPDDKLAVLSVIEKNIYDMSLPDDVISDIPDYKYTIDGLKTEIERERVKAAESDNDNPFDSGHVDDYESPDYGSSSSNGFYSNYRNYNNYKRNYSYYPRYKRYSSYYRRSGGGSSSGSSGGYYSRRFFFPSLNFYTGSNSGYNSAFANPFISNPFDRIVSNAFEGGNNEYSK